MTPITLPPDRTVLVAGRFALESFADGGGQAEVWRAVDVETGDPVAVKLFTGDMSSGEDFPRRLKREIAQATALMDDGVAVVRLIASGDDDGFQHVPYIVMEWMAGGSLRRLMPKDGDGPPIPLGDVARMLFEAASAIDGVHKRCVHRDICPANLLLDEAGHVFVGDFGIVRGEQDTTISSTGLRLGKLRYMAPEQSMGNAEHASDRFSLAVVAFELLTGKCPFTANEIIVAGVQGQLKAPSPTRLRPELPSSLDWVFKRALHPDPKARSRHYPDAVMFVADLIAALIVAQDAGDSRAVPADDRIDGSLYPLDATRRIPNPVAARVRADAAGFAHAAGDIGKDLARGARQLRARLARIATDRPGLPLMAALGIGALAMLWLVVTVWGAGNDWINSWPQAARSAAQAGVGALGLQATAGLPTTREGRIRSALLMLALSWGLIELWKIAAAEGGPWRPLALAATSATVALALLWRAGRRELVARIGLSAVALAMCFAFVQLALRLMTDADWLWRHPRLRSIELDSLTTRVQWLAGITAVLATAWQATQRGGAVRDIVTVPVWATVLAASLATISWTLIEQNLVELLGDRYSWSYLAVCAAALIVAAPVLTAFALPAQRRFGSYPSVLLVWSALAAATVAVFTLHVTGVGPAVVFGTP
jgi:serine/threonine-protein kinase